nr:basic helix-loop-helix transcription factor [Loropetalum chinense var. rubrum]
MLALSPPLFSTFGWPLEDQLPLISHEQNNFVYRDSETPESFLHLPSSSPQIEFDHSTPSATFSGDPTMVKKLNHNASERDRRKKINSLYSTLRSLLPATDQLKKLSIPATVSRVLKFIPEQQQHVERLIQKKEELLSKISKQGDQVHPQKQRKLAKIGSSNLSAVSASRLGDREVMIQISTFKVHKNPLSEILLSLEEDGLHLINASTFESYGGRVFYNLHLQVEGTLKLECEVLSGKLLSLYQKREESFP